MATRKPTYNASDIQALEGLEPARKRPAMYIGGTASPGYHHLLWELPDNSADAGINASAATVAVTPHKDGGTAPLTTDGPGKEGKGGGEEGFEDDGGIAEYLGKVGGERGKPTVPASASGALAPEGSQEPESEASGDESVQAEPVAPKGAARAAAPAGPLKGSFYLASDSDVRLEVALIWTESTDEHVRSYVNGIPTPNGGTHEAG